MKRELLRINHLNYTYTRTRELENVSFCIQEGECIGFLGLTYSGKDLLAGLLGGEITEGRGSGAIYVGGQKVSDWDMLGKGIYRMRPDNYRIEDWTVAEYLCLVDARWAGAFWRRGVLEAEAGEYFIELELDVDVSERMSQLSEIEKRIVDVVKAYRQRARIIILEDEFDGMSQDDIRKFGQIMRRLICSRMCVIVNSNSNFILSVLSDKYIIFNKGRIVKKCAKDYVKSEEQMELYLLGENGMSARDKVEDLNFMKGEVVTLITHDRREKERLFLTLSGRRKSEDVHYILSGKRYDNMDCYELTQEKVVSVRALGSREEVFEHMTIGENLMLPSLKKISFWDYIRSSGGIRKMMLEDMEGRQNAKDIKVEELGVHERIQMTLERWYIFNPMVLILFEPFALCDVKDVVLVKKYVKRFANKGTTVVIINTREEYVEDISDRIVHIG